MSDEKLYPDVFRDLSASYPSMTTDDRALLAAKICKSGLAFRGVDGRISYADAVEEHAPRLAPEKPLSPHASDRDRIRAAHAVERRMKPLPPKERPTPVATQLPIYDATRDIKVQLAEQTGEHAGFKRAALIEQALEANRRGPKGGDQ